MVRVLSFFKSVPKIITISAGVLILLLFPADSQSAEFGIVTAFNLNVRSGPDQDASSLKVLKQGTRVRILKHIDGWLEVYHEGQTGFIRNRPQYVRIITPKGKKAVTRRETPRSMETVQKETRGIQREIEKRKADVKAFTQKETTLINGLNEIDLSLNKTRQHVSEFRSDLAALEGQIKETAKTVKALLRSIESSEAYVAKRLVALYKMNMMGKMQMLASAESMYGFFIRKAALERILTYDEAVQKSLLEKKTLIAKLLDRLNTKKAERLSLEDKYQRQIKFMSKERRKRHRLLSEIQSKKSLEMAAIESLKQAAVALDDIIKSFGSEKMLLSAVNKKPLQKSFSALKGFLKMPVNGKVVSGFGPYTNRRLNVKGFRSGIHIKADRGEPIHAVSGGKIIYSSWFKGYGNMLIIDHGNSYYTVYAHAEELFKTKGEVVGAEEVVATVGDTGAMAGPRLYFEVRYHGKPLNPIGWIKKG